MVKGIIMSWLDNVIALMMLILSFFFWVGVYICDKMWVWYLFIYLLGVGYTRECVMAV